MKCHLGCPGCQLLVIGILGALSQQMLALAASQKVGDNKEILSLRHILEKVFKGILATSMYDFKIYLMRSVKPLVQFFFQKLKNNK